MLPTATMNQEIEFAEQPARTYQMLLDDLTIHDFADGQDAMKQAIYKILNTERYNFCVYSWNYGVELADLFGRSVSYVIPEIERRIAEALLQDTRITKVDNFAFDIKKNIIGVRFTAHTIFGAMEAERAVSF